MERPTPENVLTFKRPDENISPAELLQFKDVARIKIVVEDAFNVWKRENKDMNANVVTKLQNQLTEIAKLFEQERFLTPGKEKISHENTELFTAAKRIIDSAFAIEAGLPPFATAFLKQIETQYNKSVHMSGVKASLDQTTTLDSKRNLDE
ncbi:MAG: hypothetical protein HOE53_02965 [Candidatus Magasanikbacteria bacterium]|jgi:hypothetical protein|nr:hypothetical protein [Candidatus Magasanikbacteria bacterium]